MVKSGESGKISGKISGRIWPTDPETGGKIETVWFGFPSLIVLGSSWGRFWVLLGSFWCFWGLLKVL